MTVLEDERIYCFNISLDDRIYLTSPLTLPDPGMKKRLLYFGACLVTVALTIYVALVDRDPVRYNHERMLGFTSRVDFAAKHTWSDHSLKHILTGPNPLNQKNRSRILCLVPTIPENELTKALAVNNTWGPRCDKHLFLYSHYHSIFPHLSLNVTEGRSHLTAKTMEAMRYVHTHYRDEFDFVVKADDDTYLIVENLRLLLSNFSAEEPAYLGFHFKMNVHQGYMSGGGSYVLSRAALRMLVEKGLTKEIGCVTDSADEDVEVGWCMERLGVKPFLTRDRFGRDAFHPQTIKQHMVGPMKYYLSYYPTHPIQLGPECCSQFSISFHYVDPSLMYVIDSLLYRIDVFGRVSPSGDQLKNFFMKQESRIKHATEDEVYTKKAITEYNFFIPLANALTTSSN